jgi:hypothetical protein
MTKDSVTGWFQRWSKILCLLGGLAVGFVSNWALANHSIQENSAKVEKLESQVKVLEVDAAVNAKILELWKQEFTNMGLAIKDIQNEMKRLNKISTDIELLKQKLGVKDNG